MLDDALMLPDPDISSPMSSPMSDMSSPDSRPVYWNLSPIGEVNGPKHVDQFPVVFHQPPKQKQSKKGKQLGKPNHPPFVIKIMWDKLVQICTYGPPLKDEDHPEILKLVQEIDQAVIAYGKQYNTKPYPSLTPKQIVSWMANAYKRNFLQQKPPQQLGKKTKPPPKSKIPEPVAPLPILGRLHL